MMPQTPEGPSAGGSNQVINNIPIAMAKDRPCPYCEKPFTSSSLGRHLDLYIRDKNPKPSDGVHDVERIRKMREKITRRQPRGSITSNIGNCDPSPDHGSSSGPDSNPTSKKEPVESSISNDSDVPNDRSVDNEMVSNFNQNPTKLSWQATGVMPDVPPRPNSHDKKSDVRQNSWNKPLVETSGRRPAEVAGHPWGDRAAPGRSSESKSGHAAEFALKDVLRNIQYATARLHQPQPYDFDIFALNFPGLCLKVLPSPVSLFSTTPMSAPDSWPLEPPHEAQFDALREILSNRTRVYLMMFPPDELRAAKSRSELDQGLAKALDIRVDRYCQHIGAAFDKWKSLDAIERHRLWQLEVARAYAGEVKEHRETQKKLENAEEVINSLKTQLKNLQDMQKSWGQSNVNRAPLLPLDVTRELLQSTKKPDAWDFDSIMEKYRGSGPPASTPSQAVNGSGTMYPVTSNESRSSSQLNSFSVDYRASPPDFLSGNPLSQGSFGQYGSANIPSQVGRMYQTNIGRVPTSSFAQDIEMTDANSNRIANGTGSGTIT